MPGENTSAPVSCLSISARHDRKGISMPVLCATGTISMPVPMRNWHEPTRMSREVLVYL